MIYKLFIWKHENRYILVFPEIDPGAITIGKDKEDAKEEAISKANKILKTLDEYPKNRSIEDMYEILTTLPDNTFISASGIEFNEN